MRKILIIILVILSTGRAIAQVENVPVVHPVYEFLIHCEARGLLPHYSTSSLPWQRSNVQDALQLIKENSDKLSHFEKQTLEKFYKEFFLANSDAVALFVGPSNTNQLDWAELIGDKEKYIYYHHDSTKTTKVQPLGAFDLRLNSDEEKVLIGTLGVRFSGTIGDNFGYFLQATNGRVIGGDRQLALEDIRYRQSIKFSVLRDDIDLTESHIRYNNDWFYFEFGRQTRLLGSGYKQRLFISNLAPPFDAIKLGAKFDIFEYSYIHGSLIGIPESYWGTGFSTEIPDKYTAQHRFALKPSWGEVAFWENIIYSDRFPDLAYLNPLSFMKSLEHALHDRDNSVMGMDFTIRPLSNVQLKASYLLDDIIFEKIGEGFWSNKAAWNVGVMVALPAAVNIAAEYSRVEPYTFSHFNYQNSVTNDGQLLGSVLLPNSDEVSLLGTWFFGGRYPLEFDVSYHRHGANVFKDDTLYFNAGGDPLQTRRPQDSGTVEFLDGDLEETLSFRVAGGIEIIRGLSAHGEYILRRKDGDDLHYIRLLIQFADF